MFPRAAKSLKLPLALLLLTAVLMPLHLVAEGVEDEATFQTLRELGIQYFQGYLFSKPLPVAALTIS